MPVPDPVFFLKLKFQVRPTNPIKMEILMFFFMLICGYVGTNIWNLKSMKQKEFPILNTFSGYTICSWGHHFRHL